MLRSHGSEESFESWANVFHQQTQLKSSAHWPRNAETRQFDAGHLTESPPYTLLVAKGVSRLVQTSNECKSWRSSFGCHRLPQGFPKVGTTPGWRLSLAMMRAHIPKSHFICNILQHIFIDFIGKRDPPDMLAFQTQETTDFLFGSTNTDQPISQNDVINLPFGTH